MIAIIDSVNGMSMKCVDKESARLIIVTDDCIRTRPSGYNDAQYIEFLRTQYNETDGGNIPFHYFASSSGDIINIQPDVIEPRNHEFVGHEDDIIVLSEIKLNVLSQAVRLAISDLCTMLCKKYMINENSICFFPYEMFSDTSANQTKLDIKSAVLDGLKEYDITNVIRESYEANSDTNSFAFVSVKSPMTLKELSDITGIPQSVIDSETE